MKRKRKKHPFLRFILLLLILIPATALHAQVSIFNENFEHNSSIPSGWTQEYVYDTLNWAFTYGGNNGHPASPHNGNYNALLYYGGIYRTTKLITKAIDLSIYNNITLNFWHAQINYSGDQDYLRVYYKNSLNGSWILLASYTTDVPVWTQRSISIPNAGSACYIAFEGEARYGYGVALDDIEIKGNVATGLDVQLMELVTPQIWAEGNNDLRIAYRNTRTDTIFNLDFAYQIDNNSPVIISNYIIPDTLFANETKTYSFPSPIFLSKGSHSIKVWVKNPNRINPDDDPANDTITKSFVTGIKDTFYIDKNGNGDYLTFSSAIADLNNGVTGKVLFIVRAGTYNERISLGDIPGTNSQNTVSFQGVHKDSVILTYSGISSLNRATVIFKGADHVCFNNMTITNTAPAYAVNFLFRNQSDHNSISGCKLLLNSTATSTWSQHILFSADEDQAGSNGNNGNYNLFINNDISGGYYGVRIHGSSLTEPCRGNTFINNNFTNNYYYGIYSYYQDSLIIKGNTLSNFRNNGAIAIMSYYNHASRIESNTIHPGRYGIYLYRENINSNSDPAWILNNTISNFRDPIYQMGIYAYYQCYSIKIYHNSIHVNGTYNYNSYAAIRLYYRCEYSEIKNNILSSTGNTFLLTLYAPVNVSVDFNNYYYPNSNYDKFYNDGHYANFTTYRMSRPYMQGTHDENSFDNINPGFISLADLHLDTLNSPNLLGAYIGVKSDMDGEPRDSLYGVILGADEIPHPAHDLDIVSIDSPLVLSQGNNTLMIRLRNNGKMMIPPDTFLFGFSLNNSTWQNDTFITTQPWPALMDKVFSFSQSLPVSGTGTYDICVRIIKQLTGDPDTNDIFCIQKCVGLKDTLYIDISGNGDFTSFNQAVKALETCGISKAVHFIVRPGTYLERVVLGVFPGVSATHTLCFSGVDKDSVILIYAGNSGDRATLVFDGADHITFRDISITGMGPSFATGILFRSEANFNKVYNCNISVPVTNNGNMNPIAASNIETSVAGYGNNANYNTIENCTIKGGYYGIRFNGTDKENLCTGNRFINNLIQNQYYYGIYMSYQNQEEIRFNKLNNYGNYYAYALYNYYCCASEIDGNIIHPGRYGIFLNRENFQFPELYSLISNNMISNFQDMIYQVGIYGYYLSRKLHILHNSILVNGTSTSSGYAALRLYYCDSSLIKNNILVSQNNTWLLTLHRPDYNVIDYNQYYYPNSSSPKFYNHASYNNLVAFKASSAYLISPHDQHSIDNMDPCFVSDIDLHLRDTIAGFSGDSAGILYDADKDQRCLPAPTIGADESGPVADYTANDTMQCMADNFFIFKNKSTINSDTLNYFWDFGDNSSSTLENTSHHYSSPGIYKVVLLVISSKGCMDSLAKTIYVNPSPQAQFNVNDSGQCLAGNYFVLTNLSSIGSGPLSYNWIMDNSIVLNDSHIHYTYSLPDTYLVQLISTSTYNCSDTFSQKLYVHPDPEASFTLNNALQCRSSNRFVFNNTSQINAGNMFFQWNFGDNDTSSSKNPQHSYAFADTFEVRLISVSDQDCRDTAAKELIVLSSPNSYFTLNDSTQCHYGNQFQFQNMSTSPSVILNYLWNFGDGFLSILTNPAYSYSNPGTYDVSLVSFGYNACSDTFTRKISVYSSPKADFSINDSVQCFNDNSFIFYNQSTGTALPLNSFWDFGNGGFSSSDTPVYSFTGVYSSKVKLISGNIHGCKDSVEKNIFLLPSPYADFSIDNDKQCLKNNLFKFNNNSSIVSGYFYCIWDFGDSITSFVHEPAHSYSQADSFPVKLLALSMDQCKDSVIRYVHVFPEPKVNFHINKADQCLFDNYFVFTDSSDLINNMQYLWNFGNGDTGISPVEYRSYTALGDHIVGLLVTSPHGCKDSISKTIRIHPEPRARFSINDSIQCLDNNLFIFKDISPAFSENLTRFWTLGDGQTYSGMDSLAYTYATFNTYNVTLLLRSDYGCRDSITKKVDLYPVPYAAFEMNDSIQCLKLNEFILVNNSSISSGNISSLWDFGDGKQSTLYNSYNNYEHPGNYLIKLLNTSNKGCKDSAFRIAYVLPPPHVDLGPDKNINSDASVLLDAGDGYASYLWNTGAQTQYLSVDGSSTHGDTNVYWVMISDSFGCENTDTILVIIKQNAGLNNAENIASIKVYPNPLKGKLHIEIQHYIPENLQISIYNAEGRLIYECDNQANTEIDLSGYQTGLYLLKISGKNIHIQKKLILY